MQNHFLRSLIKENVSWWHGGKGYNEKSDNGDIGGGGSKIWHFRGDIIFEWPLKEILTCFQLQIVFKTISTLLNTLRFEDHILNILLVF